MTEREVHSDAGIKKTETFQINSLNLHLQELEEQQQTKPRESRRKEIIKIRAELKTQRLKKQFKGSMNPRADSLKR